MVISKRVVLVKELICRAANRGREKMRSVFLDNHSVKY